MRKKCEHKAKKSEQKATNTHSYIFLLVCVLCLLLFFALFLLYKTILAPCIYGWRARHNSSYCS